jgi:hypothetical protein
MASAELCRRVEKVVAYPPLTEMSDYNAGSSTRLCSAQVARKLACRAEAEAEGLERLLRARHAQDGQLVATPGQFECDRHRREQRARIRARDPEDARHPAVRDRLLRRE